VGFAHEKKALYFVVIGYADNNKIISAEPMRFLKG
jgi:hypothetical protein